MCVCMYVKYIHVWLSMSCVSSFALCFSFIFLRYSLFSFSNHHKISFIFIRTLRCISFSMLHPALAPVLFFFSFCIQITGFRFVILHVPLSPSLPLSPASHLLRPVRLQSNSVKFSKFVYHTHRGTHFVMRL